jgi:single-strand DNA-binding protein
MVKINNITLIGRTTKEPELKYTQNGKALAKVTLAVDKGLSKDMKAKMESEGKNTADFISIVFWGKVAETAAKFVGKGKMIGVSGRLEINIYEKDGQKRSFAQVVAYNLDILEWGNNSNNQNQSNSTDDEDLDDVFEPTDDSEIPF